MPEASAITDGAARAVFRVGEWRADPNTNELRRGAQAVRIEPKAMDVLAVLAARAGSVVSREELFASVWPGVVVGDEALTQSIIKLRRALGDDPRSPAYIETIAKRGYRLIAAVGDEVAHPAYDAPAEAFASNRESREPAAGATRLAWIGAGLAVLVAASAAYWIDPIERESPPASLDVAEAADARWLTVAVLPFDVLGSDREQAYFARGIGENLSTDLSRLSALRVIRVAPSASSPATTPTARYVVSGTVQRDAQTLRIHIHLVDGATREQLWAGRFERPFRDLFAVQDEIVARLVELLPAKVDEVERARLAKRYTHSLEAYDQFLRGQALFLVRRNEDNDGARMFYRKAVDIDPKFARAYASLAMTHAMDYRLRGTDKASLERAFELAETARLIDPDIPEVHWALGFVHTQGRRHEAAATALRRAIQLDRSFADGYALLAGIHTYIGEPGKSIPLLRTAMRLNPDAGYLYFLVAGRAYLFANDAEQAAINLRQALLRNPVDVEAHVLLAASLVAAGDIGGASWEADEIRSLAPDFAIDRWLETYPMTDARQRKHLAALLVRAGL